MTATEPLVPPVAPNSPGPVPEDQEAENGAQSRVWHVPHIAPVPTTWVGLFGADPDYCEPSVADRLRALADAKLEALDASRCSARSRAAYAAHARAGAYRRAADMIEEDDQ